MLSVLADYGFSPLQHKIDDVREAAILRRNQKLKRFENQKSSSG